MDTKINVMTEVAEMEFGEWSFSLMDSAWPGNSHRDPVSF